MTRHWSTLICALAASVASHGAAPTALPQQRASAGELAWIGLFTGELVDWLENENRTRELCTAPEDSEPWHACRAAKMQPKVMVIPVRSAPDRAAQRIGEVVLVAMPGVGLKVYASSGARAVQFTPDLFDADWGYGPWFHQSILARRGSWYRIPLASMGTGWIDAAQLGRGPSVIDGDGVSTRTVHPGDIVTMPTGDMLVLGIQDRVLRVRPEQASDMWCEAGDAPPLAPWKEIRIPFAQLYDAQGHLQIRYKYTRGC